jgi:hypothetical protein
MQEDKERDKAYFKDRSAYLTAHTNKQLNKSSSACSRGKFSSPCAAVPIGVGRGRSFLFTFARAQLSSRLTVLELRGMIFQGTESHTVRDGEDPPQRPMGVHSAHGMHVGICVPWLQDPDP